MIVERGSVVARDGSVTPSFIALRDRAIVKPVNDRCQGGVTYSSPTDFVTDREAKGSAKKLNRRGFRRHLSFRFIDRGAVLRKRL
jgi:hypothetical protein